MVDAFYFPHLIGESVSDARWLAISGATPFNKSTTIESIGGDECVLSVFVDGFAD